jgi:hypothetical protein
MAGSRDKYSKEDITNLLGAITDESINELYAKNKTDSVFQKALDVKLKYYSKNKPVKEVLNADKISKEDYYKYYGDYILAYKNKLLREDSSKTREDVDGITRPIFGVGLVRKKLQPVVFGRYLLDQNKLENQNLLHVFHQSGNNVKYFKATYISEDLKDLINYLLTKKSFNEKLYKLLSDDEKDMIKLVLDKSGLAKQLNLNLEKGKYDDAKSSYNELKKQYTIITSEIEQGNDSPKLERELNKVIKHLKQVITHLSKVGEISKRDATNMILSL